MVLAFAFDRRSWSGYASVQTDRGSEPTQPVSLHHQSLDFVSHHFCSFLTCSILLYVRCFTDTIICGEVVLHSLCYFMWGVCLTHPVLFMWKLCLTHPILFCVGSLCYTSCAISCGKFLFYMRNFYKYHTPHTVWYTKFLLYILYCFKWVVCLPHHVLRYIGSFSYPPMVFYIGFTFSLYSLL